MSIPDVERFTIKMVAEELNTSTDTVLELIRCHKLKLSLDHQSIYDARAGKRKEPQTFVRRQDLEAFKKKNNLSSTEQEAPSDLPEMSWIRSDRLKAAFAAYHEFYVRNKLKQNKGHKQQVIEWLDQHYRKFSSREKSIIAEVVHLDPRRPRK